MNSGDMNLSVVHGVLLEGDLGLSLIELGRACGAGSHFLIELVDEGVLCPSGDDRQAWRFSGLALRRARRATRLVRDLVLSVAGVALVMDLLERIDTLDDKLRLARGS